MQLQLSSFTFSRLDGDESVSGISTSELVKFHTRSLISNLVGDQTMLDISKESVKVFDGKKSMKASQPQIVYLKKSIKIC